MDNLPAETVTHVLKYLPVECLRRASRVSSRFYACAWNAGLCISRSIDVGLPSARREVELLEQVVQHAVAKNLPLRLSVYSFSGYPLHDSKGILPALISVIKSSMPVLVYLYLRLNSSNYDLTEPLCCPMPQLQELDLTNAMGTGGHKVRLPVECFTGEAPMLRKVTWWGFLLGPALSSPAFTNVTTLCITSDILFVKDDNLLKADVPCAHLFPNLSRLELRTNRYDLPDDLRLNFEGVVLRSLLIDDSIPLPALKLTLAFDEIPVIVLICYESKYGLMAWIEPERDDTDFSLRILDRLEPYPERFLFVVPSHRRWRRIYDLVDWPAETALPMARKRGGVDHLTYLRLDNAFLHAFLSCNIAFPALRRIHVDLQSLSAHPTLLWPPDSDRYPDPDSELIFRPEDKTAPEFENASLYDVPCAALETLTIFALDVRATVQSREVAFLGRALGQLVRPKPDKAVLALVGVDFAQPDAHTLMNQIFSAVSRKAFSGWHSREDDDEGLWEEMI